MTLNGSYLYGDRSALVLPQRDNWYGANNGYKQSASEKPGPKSHCSSHLSGQVDIEDIC